MICSLIQIIDSLPSIPWVFIMFIIRMFIVAIIVTYFLSLSKGNPSHSLIGKFRLMLWNSNLQVPISVLFFKYLFHPMFILV